MDHLAGIVLSCGDLRLVFHTGLFVLVDSALPEPASLFSPLQSLLLPLTLADELVSLQEKFLGELIQLHIQEIQLLNVSAHVITQLHIGGTRAVNLCEGGYEPQTESVLEQVLCLALELCQAIEGHVLQVTLGAGQENGVALALVHGGEVVAAHQAEIGQHAHLPVVGQV